MGWDLNKLPPSVMRRIVEQNAAKTGINITEKQPSPVTLPTPKYLSGEEKKLQQDCENYLRQKDIFFLRIPMHRATGIRLGWPDFAVFFSNYRHILVEMKVEGGSLSEDQIKLHDEYQRQTGQRVCLVNSFDQFVNLVRSF